MRSKFTLMVLSRYSLMLCGISHRHCVSRCAYGTTYSVGVFVMSGAFMVCARPAMAIGNAHAATAQYLIHFTQFRNMFRSPSLISVPLWSLHCYPTSGPVRDGIFADKGVHTRQQVLLHCSLFRRCTRGFERCFRPPSVYVVYYVNFMRG